MRKLIYTHMVSLDGYIEVDESSEHQDWAIGGDDLQRHFYEIESTIDAHLYGRKVYEVVASAWSMFAGDPSVSKDRAAYAHLWMEKPKFVFSRTLEHAEWNTRVINDDAVEVVRKLKAEAGNDLMLYGGNLAAALIPHGLVDEYRLYIQPVVIGTGTLMFQGLDDLLRLRLLETRTFDGGVVLHHYASAEA